jgi:Tol biopolymer transport system component
MKRFCGLVRLVVVISLFATACGGSQPTLTSDAGTGPLGEVFGPVGTHVAVSVGGGTADAGISAADVPASTQPAMYFHAPVRLPTALAATGSYEVSLGAPAANQTCSVFMGQSGTGSALTQAGAIRVGCEWTDELVSRGDDDTPSDGASALGIGGADVQIGATPAQGEGRFVIFRTTVPGAPRQIFWRDRRTGVTRLVSHAPDGSPADADTTSPVISSDGQTVAFVSYASNLVAQDTNGDPDVFVWSAANDAVERVTVGPGGEEADDASDAPTLSGDGSVIAFTTNATTIAPIGNDGTSTRKVVRIDRVTGERVVISRHSATGDPADGSDPMLSEDGNRLVFQSFKDVSGDINTYAWDIFVYDQAQGSVRPVTLTSDGLPHDGAGSCLSCGTTPAISGDGKWVTFADASKNLLPGVSDGRFHLWLVEVDACAPSPDTCHIQLMDRAADGTPADADAPNRRAPLTHDGRYTSFASEAANLGAPHGAYPQVNVFVFDRDASPGSPKVLPMTALTENNTGAADDTALSRGGAYVAFVADGHLDPRFDTAGAYAGFTGLGDAFSWDRGVLQQ